MVSHLKSIRPIRSAISDYANVFSKAIILRGDEVLGGLLSYAQGFALLVMTQILQCTAIKLKAKHSALTSFHEDKTIEQNVLM